MNPLLLMSREAGTKIRDGGNWGELRVKVSDAENVAYVSAVSSRSGITWNFKIDPRNHFLNTGDDRPVGLWYRVPAELHVHWVAMAVRKVSLKLSAFADLVPSGFKSPGSGGAYFAVTYAPDVEQRFPGIGVPEFVAWRVAAEGVEAVNFECEPELIGMRQLVDYWPVDVLSAVTVMVIGTGSIGSAVAHALAGYGVGRLLLVDPDRLRWHNLVRHTSGPKQVGKTKVSALRDDLRDLRPDTDVEAFPLDVVADADQIRPLLGRVDLVVCAADGVAPRRVVSHLARRARRDAVLACVLENGGLGEVIRLRPWSDHGCLVCRRETLTHDGAIDPEPHLDAGYGTGTRHRPMTAVSGDLQLVGQLAAKTAVATILESNGYSDQRLPGEHALIGLRPVPGWPPPFNLSRAGDVRWIGASTPLPGCPTCEQP